MISTLEKIMIVVYSISIVLLIYGVYNFTIRGNVFGVLVALAFTIAAIVIPVRYFRNKREE